MVLIRLFALLLRPIQLLRSVASGDMVLVMDALLISSTFCFVARSRSTAYSLSSALFERMHALTFACHECMLQIYFWC